MSEKRTNSQRDYRPCSDGRLACNALQKCLPVLILYVSNEVLELFPRFHVVLNALAHNFDDYSFNVILRLCHNTKMGREFFGPINDVVSTVEFQLSVGTELCVVGVSVLSLAPSCHTPVISVNPR